MKKNLHQMSNEELGKLFPIILSEYQESWKQLYQVEKEVITGFLGKNLVSIEHIGSTSIPGLIAKPTIDILVQIDNCTDLSRILRRITITIYNNRPNQLLI